MKHLLLTREEKIKMYEGYTKEELVYKLVSANDIISYLNSELIKLKEDLKQNPLKNDEKRT